MNEQRPRVRRVLVANLFGLYRHDVELNLDERITILHGQNGVGKTVLLHLIAWLFHGSYLEMMKVPFDEFSVALDNGDSATVKQFVLPVVKSPRDPQGRARRMFEVNIERGGHIVDAYRLDVAQCFGAANRLAQEFPYMARVEFDEWSDNTHRFPGTVPTVTAVNRWRERVSEQTREAFPAEPESLATFRGSVEITLIEAQRLLKIQQQPDMQQQYVIGRSVTPQVNTAVESIAQELKQDIGRTLTQYASESQRLDQEFPRQLLGELVPPLSSDILKDKFRKLEERLLDFRKNGLVEETILPLNLDSLDNLEEAQRRAISLYVENMEKKLDVLKGLSERMNLLLQIVKDKFRHKSIAIRKDKGLVAVDDHGRDIDLDLLSSGEQHELVMAYDLLFTVSKNSLVLIDEPELSLHLSWQRAFLPDLFSIVRQAEFDVLLATHSPFIVGDYSNLMVELASEDESP